MTNEKAIRKRFSVRSTCLPDDGEKIMEVFAAAKTIMAESGNTKQWKAGYPSLDNVRRDMSVGGSYVVTDGDKIVAYFAFLPSPEPTYDKIYDGQWLDDEQPYHVIHRISSYPDVHGIFNTIMEYCSAREENLRIDTHRDNLIMQHNILKHGFTYCGVIFLASGDERLAYQRLTGSAAVNDNESK